jgi:hypothetical protein
MDIHNKIFERYETRNIYGACSCGSSTSYAGREMESGFKESYNKQ